MAKRMQFTKAPQGRREPRRFCWQFVMANEQPAVFARKLPLKLWHSCGMPRARVSFSRCFGLILVFALSKNHTSTPWRSR